MDVQMLMRNMGEIIVVESIESTFTALLVSNHTFLSRLASILSSAKCRGLPDYTFLTDLPVDLSLIHISEPTRPY